MKKKGISKILIESAFNHKEKIDPSVYTSLENRSHYNANNSIYPQTVGRGNYLSTVSQKNFHNALNKLKRVYAVDDINPQKYFEIKKGVGQLLRDINNLESSNLQPLMELAEKTIRDFYDIPQEIKFSINGDEIDEFDGTNMLEQFQETYQDFKFDDYTGIEVANNTIDRQRLNYSLICGGAHNAMNLYKSIEDELDSIDYRLYDIYNKFNSFNNFNLWVTPDDVISNEVEDSGEFKIYDNGQGYTILINAQSFLSMLYEMSKGVLSILFQEKYNNPHIDYSNPWNTRVGIIAWDNLKECANQNKNFPYIIDAMNDLDDEDYSYVVKEVLSQTNHSKNIFSELYKSFDL